MIDPSKSQMQAYMKTDQASPVIFLNCHRYHSTARYPANYQDDRYPVEVAGCEACQRDLEEFSSRFALQVGGRLLLAGAGDMVFIGEGDWDEVVVGQYTSQGGAMPIPTMPGYEESVINLKSGLKAVLTMVLSPRDFPINTLT